MTEKDFRQFAERVKHSGLTTKQALDKFLKALMASPKLKIVKKQTIRSYENGIKTFPGGRERCMTKEAWNRRRDEVFARDERPGWVGVYDCAGHCGSLGYEHLFEVDHIRKRSLGRDDRLVNLQLLCPTCHRKKHDSFKKRGQP